VQQQRERALVRGPRWLRASSPRQPEPWLARQGQRPEQQQGLGLLPSFPPRGGRQSRQRPGREREPQLQWQRVRVRVRALERLRQLVQPLNDGRLVQDRLFARNYSIWTTHQQQGPPPS